ncbi:MULTISPECIES: type I polyketide synthase [Streptomyces]|uniref:Polyketide synthase n=1 Tax=Streptomyces dengpaensis TaxID=2049881 RepID=A0ABM6SMZ0_9ACTN|nr:MULTISPECIES: type I polyketide synthase [Streptomyces]AVH55795.1 polyketide synthase [Streptomyces dengpaensis]PIB12051.1 hypothetical protein B1C81_02395 [Streptomyces sp. HG99]
MSAPPVAIIGIDCVFPGAHGKDGLWELLTRGASATRDVPADRWEASRYLSDAPGAPEGTMNTARGGYLNDIGAFDNAFFGIPPREAAAMDPQQRVLLQCAWRAVEDAGLRPGELDGSRTGVFVGVMGDEWALRMGDFGGVGAHTGPGTGHAMVANRLSYQLNLRGPSLAVDTACSSSLVAVHLACESLARGECDTALVAGVNVILTPALGIFYTQAGLSAPDGQCKPFHRDADGIGRGEGAAVLVLRRLQDALDDHDPVYAVVRGSAVNHGGRSNGFTAPSRFSQRDVMTEAYRRAEVRPQDVDFVEVHGTGTVLGDLIEASALGDVHGVPRERPCTIGSVKGNVGHTEGAAGAAGLVKAALALHHRLLPTTLHSHPENPRLRLAERGLRLAAAPLRLPATAVGSVSSFGLGGTNAHLVLSSAPAAARSLPHARLRSRGGTPMAPRAGRPAADTPHVFTLSAPDRAALRRNAAAQAEHVSGQRGGALAEVCRSANRVKTGLPYRFAVVAEGRSELTRALEEAAQDDTVLDRLSGRPAGGIRVGLLFTGQGAQYPGMTAALHRRLPLYRRFLAEADEACGGPLGYSVTGLILGDDPRIHRTGAAQPALFAVEYALGRTLLELGVEPAFVLGHSVGEFAAVCLAGVLSLADAARLVCLRGALMEQLPPGGGMLAVLAGLPETVLALASEPSLQVAAVNGPRNTVVSGDLAALGRLRSALLANGVRSRALEVSHAFHSSLMEPMTAEFEEAARAVRHDRPTVPVFSSVLGGGLADTAVDADYWVRQITQPVLFADAARAALAPEPTHVVEVGPRAVLTALLGSLDLPGNPRRLAVCSGEKSDARAFAEVVAALYRGGLDVDWESLHPPAEGPRHRPAPYRFSTEHRFTTSVTPTGPAHSGTLTGPAHSVTPTGPAHSVTPTGPAHSVTPTGPARPDHPASGYDHAPVPRTAVAPVATLAPIGAVAPVATLTPAGPVAPVGPIAPAAPASVEAAVLAAVAAAGGYASADIGAETLLYDDLGYDSMTLLLIARDLGRRFPGLDLAELPERPASSYRVSDLVSLVRGALERSPA